MPPQYLSYFPYYSRLLETAETGIKLVLGGTGLGKTSIIPQVVQEHPNRKFIYIANRRRLLSEMEEGVRGILGPNGFVRINRDLDQVLLTLRQPGFDDLLVSERATQASRVSPPWLQHDRVVRAVEHIRRIQSSHVSYSDLYELLDDEARIVMRFFKLVAAESGTNLTSTDRTILESLFPMMRFRRDDDVRIALVTLQKLFYGVFDGEQDVDLSSLGNYVIFLDEFDFLEQNLLDMLSKSPEIDNLFEFVAPFSRVMGNQLSHAGYAQEHPDLKRRLAEINQAIGDLQDEGFDFPAHTRCFLMPDTHLPDQGVQLFRTNRSVTVTPIRIWQAERGFEIAPAHDVDPYTGASLSRVLGILHNTSRRILTLLKEYKRAQPSVYEELRWQCYGASRSLYYQMIERIGQFPRSRLTARTGFDSLLSNGFNVFEIEDLGQSLDPDAVEIRSMALYSTPERILLDMTCQNLVFGLSATADIERHLHHFDLKWLREQDGVHWLSPTSDDRELIRRLGEEKLAQRNNCLHTYHLSPLQSPNLHRVVEQLSGEPGFADKKSTEHHRARVLNFFAALEWIDDHCVSEDNGSANHLMFVSSFRQIRLLFNIRIFQQGPNNAYRIESTDISERLEVYRLHFGERSYLVLFLNAEQGVRILDSEEARQEYDSLFRSPEPVIVITQYASAGAGVNLQFRPDPQNPGHESDFSHVYFLDLPFFFFGQEDEHGNATRKKNIWQLAKLYHSKQLSLAQFRRFLGETSGSVLSQEYLKGSRTYQDACLNQLVVLIQALGRFERVWNPVPDQHVILSNDALDVFERFLHDEDFEHIREQRAEINSPNLSMALEGIQELSIERQRLGRRSADRRLPIQDRLCKEKIEELLARLERLRDGYDGLEAREIWEAIRTAALRHDFQLTVRDENHPLLEQYAMLYPTSYVSFGHVRLDDDNHLLNPDLGIGRDWQLDAAYDLVRENPVIQRYFDAHGYEMAFISSANIIFVPYAYQSILMGGIGEAAIAALLEERFGRGTLEAVPDPLFELIDLKLENLPVFIDAKNYSELTLARFGFEPLDPDWHPKLNSERFPQSAIRKLERIQYMYGPDGHLVYINLVSSADRDGIERYDAQFQPVERLTDARIIVVRGALNRENPAILTHGMQILLDHLRQMGRA